MIIETGFEIAFSHFQTFTRCTSILLCDVSLNQKERKGFLLGALFSIYLCVWALTIVHAYVFQTGAWLLSVGKL